MTRVNFNNIFMYLCIPDYLNKPTQPGLSSIVTGYLPSVALISFICGVPCIMRALSGLEGFTSGRGKEIKTCTLVYYYLGGNVFFLSFLSCSLVEQIDESFPDPRDFLSRLT